MGVSHVWDARWSGALEFVCRDAATFFSVQEDSRYEDDPFGFVLRCWDVSRG